MENIGDWLYMIVIIIAIISSFIGSIKKANKQAAGKPQPPEVITEEWEKKYFPDNDAELPHPVFHEKKTDISPQIQMQQTTKPAYNRLSKNQKSEKDYSIFKGETTLSNPASEDEGMFFSIEDMPSNINEWRKAFIYNEVFNRKY